MSTTKEIIVRALFVHLDQRIAEIRTEIDSSKHSIANETKSSAGDKFETARSMIQMELAQHEAQLQKFNRMKSDLERMPPITDRVISGSLVDVSGVSYFIGLSLGKVNIETGALMCISPTSPIAQSMLGKTAGESFEFNGSLHTIESVE